MKSLFRQPRMQALFARLLGRYLHFALHTTRWTLHGQDNWTPHLGGRAAIVAFWHEYLPLLPALTFLVHQVPGYRPVPISALVSPHRDGRLIGAVLRRFGLDAVLGSSNRGGAAGMLGLVRLLARNQVIAITPDGPRGPRREAEPGVAQLAALAGVPVLAVAARTRRRVVLNTWDRMAIPLPFGRGVMVCGAAVTVPRQGWEAGLPAITTALNQAAELAEQLCPG